MVHIYFVEIFFFAFLLVKNIILIVKKEWIVLNESCLNYDECANNFLCIYTSCIAFGYQKFQKNGSITSNFNYKDSKLTHLFLLNILGMWWHP